MSFLFGCMSKALRPMMATQFETSFGSQNYNLLTTLRFKQSMKTHSGIAKRIRVRGSGSLKRMKSGRSHNTGYKGRQRLNRLGSSTGVEGKKIEQRVRKMLGAY